MNQNFGEGFNGFGPPPTSDIHAQHQYAMGRIARENLQRQAQQAADTAARDAAFRASTTNGSSYSYSGHATYKPAPLTPEQQAEHDKNMAIWRAQEAVREEKRQALIKGVQKLAIKTLIGIACIGAVSLIMVAAKSAYDDLDAQRKGALHAVEVAQAQKARIERTQQFTTLMKSYEGSPLLMAGDYLERQHKTVGQTLLVFNEVGADNSFGVASQDFKFSGFIAPHADGVPQNGQCALFSVTIENGLGEIVESGQAHGSALRKFESGIMCRVGNRWTPKI